MRGCKIKKKNEEKEKISFPLGATNYSRIVGGG